MSLNTMTVKMNQVKAKCQQNLVCVCCTDFHRSQSPILGAVMCEQKNGRDSFVFCSMRGRCTSNDCRTSVSRI